jgi:hypothetical protein
MSRVDAKSTLEVIDSIAERSHSYTIATPEVVGVVNNCIRTLAVSADGQVLTWESIVTEYGSVVANFIQKMKDGNRFQKVYQPGRYGQNEDTIVSQMCGIKKSSSSSKKTKSSTTTQSGQLR